MQFELTGHDVFLRFDGGPVQHFRVWDHELFYAAQLESAAKEKPPRKVTHCTREAYEAERRRRG